MFEIIQATILDVDYSHGIIFAIDLNGNEFESSWTGLFIPDTKLLYQFKKIDNKYKLFRI